MIESDGRYRYAGSELQQFAHATRWKRYWASRIRPFIGRCVLEVGAGIGGSTVRLCDGTQATWVCLEPDARHARELARRIDTGELPSCCAVRTGTLAQVASHERFDTVLYLDVLEHIEADGRELDAAGAHLKAGGHLIVLAPAHQVLFSAFDQAIGHHRRYTRSSLARIAPRGMHTVVAEYLDSAGMLASLANRWVLRDPTPSFRQIALWDAVLVPVSRLLDPLLARRLGKSVLMVWRR